MSLTRIAVRESISLERLRQPFPSDELSWWIRRSLQRGERQWLQVVPYLPVPVVLARLDDVLGGARWRMSYRSAAGSSVICTLALRVGESGEWIEKEGVGSAPEGAGAAAPRAAAADALIRAGNAWGVGRYVHRLGNAWVEPTERGRCRGRLPDGRVVRFNSPPLPGWAQPPTSDARAGGARAA